MSLQKVESLPVADLRYFSTDLLRLAASIALSSDLFFVRGFAPLRSSILIISLDPTLRYYKPETSITWQRNGGKNYQLLWKYQLQHLFGEAWRLKVLLFGGLKLLYAEVFRLWILDFLVIPWEVTAFKDEPLSNIYCRGSAKFWWENLWQNRCNVVDLFSVVKLISIPSYFNNAKKALSVRSGTTKY